MDLIIGGNQQTPSQKPADATAPGDQQPTPAMGGGSAQAMIVDANINTFEEEVMNASMEVPVLVDFWADWCGPCRQLTPLLEKIVTEAKGAVKLVKVNADQNPELCQMLRIQSLPTVYAFWQGRPVDAMVGAVPESQVRSFITKLAQLAGPAALPHDAMMEQASAALGSGKTEEALALYSQVFEEAPDNAKARGGLSRTLVALGDVESAKELLENLPANVAVDAEITAARAAIEVAEQAAQAGPVDDLQKKIEAHPDDHAARFDLAVALYAAGQQETAMSHLIEIIRRERNWNDDAARKQLVTYFDALGAAHPLTAKMRRQLSTILFS